MKRRTALAACVALGLTTMTGAFAARQLFYHPFDGLTAQGHTWNARFSFQGEVKCYDADGNAAGSFGHNGDKTSPLAAVVTVDGNRYDVKGDGRHEIRDSKGRLLGSVELAPESDEERRRGMSDYKYSMGVKEPLKISHGCDDGFGTAIGYFGDKTDPHRIEWRLRGVGVIRFRRVSDNSVAYAGTALEPTPDMVAEQHRNMLPDQFAMLVLPDPPRVPVFEWTAAGETHQEAADHPIRLTLPDGTRVMVEVGPATP